MGAVHVPLTTNHWRCDLANQPIAFVAFLKGLSDEAALAKMQAVYRYFANAPPPTGTQF